VLVLLVINIHEDKLNARVSLRKCVHEKNFVENSNRPEESRFCKNIYWVVCADFEGKLKRRRFKF